MKQSTSKPRIVGKAQAMQDVLPFVTQPEPPASKAAGVQNPLRSVSCFVKTCCGSYLNPPMKKIAVATVIALGALSSAQAQYYGEVAYLSTTVKASETGFKAKLNAVRATLGYEVNTNLAVEAMLATGLGSKKITDEDDIGGRLKFSNSFGMYVKPKFQLSEDWEIFARLGFTRASLKATWDDGDSGKTSTTKSSYGVGTSYQVTPKVSINADYMHYTKNEGVTSRGFAIGVGYKF